MVGKACGLGVCSSSVCCFTTNMNIHILEIFEVYLYRVEVYTYTLWWFHFFLFSSLLGEIIQFDEHIFQMGWFNHQPDSLTKA